MAHLPQDNNNTIRLNKFLAERLGISRREADDAIASGKVTIDGKPAMLGSRLGVPTPDKLDFFPKVCYNGSMVPFQADFLYLAFHKPIGYVCSRRAQGDAPTLYELLPPQYRNLKTVGRLDKDSSGLILLTNDGDFAYQMTHPKFRKEKIYEVELDRPLAPLHQQMISDYGVSLEDGVSRFTVIRDVSARKLDADDYRRVTGMEGDPHPQLARMGEENARQDPSGAKSVHYTVILTEGRNRQIRRTFAALGYRVVKLHRTQFGKYGIGDLAVGKYQEFAP